MGAADPLLFAGHGLHCSIMRNTYCQRGTHCQVLPFHHPRIPQLTIQNEPQPSRFREMLLHFHLRKKKQCIILRCHYKTIHLLRCTQPLTYPHIFARHFLIDLECQTSIRLHRPPKIPFATHEQVVSPPVLRHSVGKDD